MFNPSAKHRLRLRKTAAPRRPDAPFETVTISDRARPPPCQCPPRAHPPGPLTHLLSHQRRSPTESPRATAHRNARPAPSGSRAARATIFAPLGRTCRTPRNLLNTKPGLRRLFRSNDATKYSYRFYSRTAWTSRTTSIARTTRFSFRRTDD